MPPPAQFTKEAILNEAFEILRSEGIEAVSARSIAKRLGSSTQPVYSAYASMDSLKADLVEMARGFASSFLVTNDEGEEPFLSIGIQYLRLARGEREVFKLLYMSGLDGIDPADPFSPAELIERMKFDGHLTTLDEATLRRLLGDMWVFTHGLATLLYAAKTIPDEATLREKLKRVGGALIMHELSVDGKGELKCE